MGKTVLITGASTGLGHALALEAAGHGHQVWASMRRPDKKEGLLQAAAERGLSLQVVQLDVEQEASVQAAVAQVLNEAGKLDVLVNNAGAGFLRATEQASESEVQWVMNVNFHGVVRCTKAVLPAMRAAQGGHIINITSVGGLVGQPFNEIYCAAKFAVEGYTEAMASYMEPGFGIRFTLVEPGGIHSDFVKNVMGQMQASGGLRQDDYLPLLQAYIGSVQSRSPEQVAQIYQTPEQVAQVVTACMEQDNPPLRLRTSPWAAQFCHLKTGLDPDGRLLLAQVKQNLLGIQENNS